ncbi:MAG: hypothetical protein ACTSQF_11505 [Candidatus Heimdallarchaeaceae archaeon]
MKKFTLFLGTLLLTLGLFSTQVNTQAAVESPIEQPSANALNGPPEVLFDLSGMIGSSTITVIVWDTYYDLTNATVLLNGAEQNGSFNYVDYTVTSPPFSLHAEAGTGDNTYTVDIPTSELEEGEDHNEIEVIAWNTNDKSVVTTLGLCRTVDCWGPGPLPLSVKNSYSSNPSDTINLVDTTAPIIDFDASCLTQCGSINPIIYDYESGIEYSNFTFENELLIVYAINGEGLWSRVGIDVTGLEVDCIGCVQQEECEESTANVGIGGIIIAIGLLGIPIKGKTIFKWIFRKKP